MLTLFVVIISYFILFFLTGLTIRRFIFSGERQGRRNRIPGPFPLPIIGNLHVLGPNLHWSFDELAGRYGPIFQLRVGSKTVVVISSPGLAREFLKTHDLALSYRKESPAIKLLTYDVSFAFSPYGDYWKFIKKLFTSELLGARNLDNFRLLRTEEVLRFLRALVAKARAGEPANVTQELLKIAYNIISQMMLSQRGSERDSEEARAVIREVTDIFGKFDVADIIGFGGWFDFQGIRKRAQQTHERYDALLEKFIVQREDERRHYRQHTPTTKEESGKDLLDMLLDIMENGTTKEVKLTRNHIKALILDFITAATDTSAITLEWAIAELTNNPRVLEKAQKEIEQVVGSNRLVDELDGRNLPYIQAIIKETFRLHPPIPMLIRKCISDIVVGNNNGYNNYEVKANSLVFVNIWSIGRNTDHWDRPSKFRPERFLEPDKGDPVGPIDVKGHNFELLPFGSGRRSCPGLPLAMQEIPIVLASLIQCFEWELPLENTNRLDMNERPGLTCPRAHDLVLRLVPKLDLPILNTN